MKAYFFHLMPWTDFPADFDEKFESSWVIFPNTHFDPEKGHALYNRYLDELEYADQLGYDGICVNEHHQNAYGLMPSPNVIAGMLARRTKHAKIAILGNGLPLRNNPLRIAEEVAMLDVITGGRIISGFVRGIGAEYFSLDLDPTESRERFTEAHDLIIRAWTEPGPFQFFGKHFEYRYVNVWPRPLQKPHPPIWLPSSGSPETVDLAAKNRYPCVTVFVPYGVVRGFFEEYRAVARERYGYEPDPEQLGVASGVHLAETDAQAEEEQREYGAFFQRYAFKLPPQYLQPPGYVSEEGLKRTMERMAFREQAARGGGPADDPSTPLRTDPWADQMGIAGSPKTVVEHLIGLYDYLGGFGFVIVGGPSGNTPHDVTLRRIRMFKEDVLPALTKYQEQKTKAKVKV